MDHGAAGELGPMRHSAAHVLAEAVLDLFPGTKLGIGPVIDDGFYYDFQLPRPLTPDDLPAIEARMRESIAADHPFELSELSPADARAFLVERDQPFKVEIVDDLLAAAERDGSAMPPTTFYRQGPFIDLCRGPHVASTGKIGPFKLLGTAGAYWRGDEKRPMLQRVYGTAWATQEELDQYLWRREEAKKRDHRRLGVQLDLFSFHDVSPGSAFWHPKGQRIWRTLEAAMRELQERRGYQEVSTPILVSPSACGRPVRPLGPTTATTCSWSSPRPAVLSLKPMNCPESDVHLPEPPALVPRPAAALQPSTAGSTATSGPGRCPGSPASGSSSRTTATSTCGRTSWRTRSRRFSARSARRTGGSGSSRAYAFATKPDKAPSATRRSGSGPRGYIREALERAGGPVHRQAEGRHVLRPEDRHLHRRRART